MKITSNINDVLDAINGKEDFIAIGELHNSRSAIKFILENIDELVPPEDGRRTYLLTEFLTAGAYLGNLQDLSYGDEKQFQRFETYKGEDSQGDNLYVLYEHLLRRNVEIHSIADSATDHLAPRIMRGDLIAYKDRTDSLNQLAKNKANKIWEQDASAKILIFAGMGHIANSKCKKFNGETFTEEKTMEGITELLRNQGSRRGLSINIHDPELCDDSESFDDFSCSSVENYTKYGKAYQVMSVDSPNFLLFLNAQPPHELNKNQSENYESIFFMGECNIPSDLLDPERRRENLKEAADQTADNDGENQSNNASMGMGASN